MNEAQTPLNQTQFSFEEPIFENESSYVEEQPQTVEPVGNKRGKKLLVLFVAFFIILLLVLTGVLLQRTTQEEPEEVIDATVPVTQEFGPLQQRIKDTKVLLQQVDPAKQDLAFPPVDLGIRLDPKVRR